MTVAVVGLFLAVPALQALLPPRTFLLGFGLPSVIALRGLLAFGFFGTEALIPLGLSTQRDVSPSLVGLALTAGALAWVLGSWIQDRAESLSGGSLTHRSLRAAVGLLLIAAGVAAVAVVVLSPGAPVVLAASAWAVAGLGMGLAYPSTTLTALGLAAPGDEGSAAASLQVAETVGVAVGTGAVGALFALAGYLARASSDGLVWGFVLTVSAVAFAIAPALRMAPMLSRPERRLGLRWLRLG
jgi:MFS family permease